METVTINPNWQDILNEALTKPGMISAAYQNFHNYSLGNQLLAMTQCYARGIVAGPISTYPGWQSLGRQVKRGEKALTLCMPITCKKSERSESEDPEAGETGHTFTRFIFKRNWFVLAQTEGEEYSLPALPNWDKDAALSTLGIKEEVFAHPDGNALGYAKRGKTIAVSPLSPFPFKTLFHELAHVILEHCEESALTDSESTPRSLKEIEAESVALLCAEALGLPGAEYCRGYIQSWGQGARSIPEKSAQKIFRAADRIIKAGLPAREGRN